MLEKSQIFTQPIRALGCSVYTTVLHPKRANMSVRAISRYRLCDVSKS